MKAPLCLSILIAFSLIGSHSHARNGSRDMSTPEENSNTAASAAEGSSSSTAELVIPGSRRSFLRMAAISQQITPEEELPLLSRNVFTQGYEDSSRATEYLILLRRYVGQARELAALAASNGMVIRVSGCNDAGPLLRILGFRVAGKCGDPDTYLRTDDPERAFVTIDSGFPLPELEQTLQGGKAFEYKSSSSPVPVLFAEKDWTGASVKDSNRDLLDTILNDPSVARLYWALYRMDPDTSRFLQQSVGIGKLLPYAAVLDFYGRTICVSQGRVIVPGGEKAESGWKELVGASPSSPANFVLKLVAKDKGWLAAYFDALSRSNGVQAAYFTEPHHLKLFYEALRAPDPSAPATRGSFRPAPELLRITTRLQLDRDGEPLVPGGLEVWKEILFQGHDADQARKWGKRTKNVSNPEQLVEIMFGLTRAPLDSELLRVYMVTSEIDSRRPEGRRLKPETVRLLARRFAEFSDQYPTFSEFPELSDQSITLFLDIAENLNGVSGAMRANALGLFQANVGIWQILARQGEIPSSRLDESWQRVVRPFASIRSSASLYDAGRSALAALFQSATGKSKGSQDEIIQLLAGPQQSTAEGKQVHHEVADRISSVMDDQRLVSLDTLFIVGDALTEKQQGKPPDDYAVLLASQTREFEMPRPIFTGGERSEWAAGIYNNHHTDVEMRTDVPKILKSPSPSKAQIEDARGQLASFLRDTLVGLNYAYYEPPGAQALHNNPLFVRSHDFAGETLGGVKSLWQAPVILGQGSPAGGGAHFVGSLADLPYALADVEQDFISPDNTQALIWKEVTPGLLTAAILPRWWNVSPAELHAVALYQRSGEELLKASQKDEALRAKVMSILSERLLPPQSWKVEQAVSEARAAEIIPHLMPADTFYLAAEFQRKYPEELGGVGAASQELSELCRQHPDQVNWKRISHDFGTPHPTMADTYGLELLNVMPMPPFSGDASRYMAESWDSPNLYWARLADEAGYSPVILNSIVPELTRVMVRKIFATDLEDWPALVRAMHETGTDFQDGKLAGMPMTTARR